MAQLTIQLLGWNSAPALPKALQALQSLDKNQYIIRYIDNASSDNSVELVKELLPSAGIVQLPENTGYAGGHNAGFAICTTPFVMVLNPDVELMPSALPELLKVFEDPKVAAVQGKLLRDKAIIDSTGIVMSRAMNGIERGAGQQDHDQFNSPTTIDAVTGACSIFRLSALQKVAHEGEIFDADFFAYKEDVDLGWRLRHAGFTCQYVPVLAGYHTRSLKTPIQNRLGDMRTRYSIRNWVWMVVKNLTWREDLKYELFLDARLFAYFGLTLLHPSLLSVWLEVLHGLPKMARKRKWS